MPPALEADMLNGGASALLRIIGPNCLGVCIKPRAIERII